MAGSRAVLGIDIVADASGATSALNDAASAASSAADKIDTVGGRAGDTATGLSALSGALDAAGFGPAADALNLVATGMDAAEGSAVLFKVAQESLSLTTIKDTAARLANNVATLAGSAATKAWAATQWLLNAAMTANPVGLVVAGIILLIGVIVLIATKTTWFQDAWKAAWGAIKTAAAAVWEWIGPAAEKALDIVKKPIDAVKTAFDKVGDAIESVIKWLGKIKMPDVIGKIGDALSSINPFSVSAGGGAPVPGLSARALGRGAPAAAGGGTVQVFVPESSDPVATARYLKALMRRGEAAGVIFGGL